MKMLWAFSEIILQTVLREGAAAWSSVFNLTLNNYWHLPGLPQQLSGQCFIFPDCALDNEYPFSKQILTEYGMYPEIEEEKMGSRVSKSQAGLCTPVGVRQTTQSSVSFVPA